MGIDGFIIVLKVVLKLSGVVVIFLEDVVK